MTSPVPTHKITTPYGRRGKHWSCQKNSAGEGIHTGADYAAPAGTKVVAARPGVVRYVNFGSAFGSKQVAITGPDGTVDFYAHMRKRVAAGTQVKTGDKVGEVGSEGNSTGNHLHFERHKNASGWSCSNVVNPQPSIDYGGHTIIGRGKVYLSKLVYGQPCDDDPSDSIKRLQQALNADGLGANLSGTGIYGGGTDKWVRECQKRHGYGNDPEKASYVGPMQATHLFTPTADTVVDDRDDPVEPCDDTPTDPTDPEEPEVPPTIPDGASLVYFYSGKPNSDQSIGTGYTEVTKSRWTAPDSDGFLFSMLYLNLAHSLTSSKPIGGIRTRMVRMNPTDETAYQDEAVSRDGVSKSAFLTTRIWFGSWKAQRPLRWDVRRSDSMGTTKAGTRYTKVLWFAKKAPMTALAHPIKTAKFVSQALSASEGEDEVLIVL